MARKGVCSKCQKSIHLSHSSSDFPVCRECRRKDPPHGLTRYRKGCRCKTCKAAHLADNERHKRGRCTKCDKKIYLTTTSSSTPVCRDCRPVHGATGYDNGCRCDECRRAKHAAIRKFTAAYRERTGKRYRSNFDFEKNVLGSKWIPKSRRLALYERDDWTCQICMKPVDREAMGTNEALAPCLDHIIPRSRGGDHSDANLRTAHRTCNGYRGVRDDDDVLEVPDVCYEATSS